jgi:ATP-dependent Lhr-like helicase
MIWTDDGIAFRLPESDEPPAVEMLVPRSDEIEDWVVRELGGTALFAARFRENAARALLLPKRHPDRRMPLWLQRRRAADLLAVAVHYPGFPLLLETYRECLRDVFDLKGLTGLLRDVESGAIHVHPVQTKSPSPFASSVLFGYTANFIYDGDAPLAERRAQTLALDHAQLRELLGDAELRELLDAEAVDAVALQLQRLDERHPIRHADALHELLLYLGDLSGEELFARCEPATVAGGDVARWLAGLLAARRVVQVRIAGEPRYAAAEDAARLRDALGVIPPPGLPEAFLRPVQEPLGDLVSRYARTHIPFHVADVATRLGVGTLPIRTALERLAAGGRVLEGEFLPGGQGREWCDNEVLRTLKRRSLTRLRKQVEPVEPAALARFLPRWQGIAQPRQGLDGLLDVIEQLQGLPLPASALERDVLPCRVSRYRPSDLDELCAAGEVVWRGIDRLGADGRIALYLTDQFVKLASPATLLDGDLAGKVRGLLGERGALFFEDLVRALGGFRNDLLDTLWQLVWAGEVTNDTLAPLRSRQRAARPNRASRRVGSRRFRSRRLVKLPGSEGRWSLLWPAGLTLPSTTERQTALAAQLLRRYGIVTREQVASEGVVGGFAGLYPVLKAMEEAGQVRRGYFVAGLGAAQFAALGAEDRLRQPRDAADDPAPQVLVLAATDPANPYGAALAWPERPQVNARPQRAVGSRVILRDGELLGYLGRTGQQLITFMPDAEPARGTAGQALAAALAQMASELHAVFLERIDGAAPGESPLAAPLVAAGFVPTTRGYLHRRRGAT